MVDRAETPQRSLMAQRPESPSAGEAGTSNEVSNRRPSSGSEDAETSHPDDDGRDVYEVWSPYLNNMQFLDEQYGIKRDGNTFKIGSAAVTNERKGRYLYRRDALQRYEGIMGFLDTQKRQ